MNHSIHIFSRKASKEEVPFLNYYHLAALFGRGKVVDAALPLHSFRGTLGFLAFGSHLDWHIGSEARFGTPPSLLIGLDSWVTFE